LLPSASTPGCAAASGNASRSALIILFHGFLQLAACVFSATSFAGQIDVPAGRETLSLIRA
jgi:hypothetical protein